MSRSELLGTIEDVRLEQGTIRYRSRGSGPPLLFFHEFPANGDTFRRVVPQLAEDYRCIVPDWPYGFHEVALESDADLSPRGIARLVDDFVASVGLEGLTLVGAGGGGTLAQVFAAAFPERVERMVLTTGDSLEHFPARSLKAFKLVAHIPPLAELFLQGGRLAPLRRFWFGLTSRHLRQEEALVYESYMRPVLRSAGVRRDIRRVIRQLNPRDSLLAAGALAALRLPTLLVWSTDDRLFPVEDAMALAELWPHARLELIDHDRTFLPEDQPERLIELVRRFLRETEA